MTDKTKNRYRAKELSSFPFFFGGGKSRVGADWIPKKIQTLKQC